MPRAIMVIMTAARMEMKEAIAKNDTFFIVRGMVKRVKRTNPTTPKTMLQVPWLVRVFMAMMNVKT